MGEGGRGSQFVRGDYESFKWINITVLEILAQFIMEGDAAQSVRGYYT